jgi:hypothetical protein
MPAIAAGSAVMMMKGSSQDYEQVHEQDRAREADEQAGV